MAWATLYIAWGLSKPRNISNMFESWLNGIPKNYKSLVLVRAPALCWFVWLCRNIVVFENKHSSFLQLIYSSIHWLRTWAILQQPTFQNVLVAASRFLEWVVKDFFYPDTWIAVDSH